MDMIQAAVLPSESSRGKNKTVAKLKTPVKRSSEEEDYLETLTRKTLIVSDPEGDSNKALQPPPWTREIPGIVASFYNFHSRDTKMEFTSPKLDIHHIFNNMPTCIFFVSFDARLTPKNGNGSPEETNCCSVLFQEFASDPFEVFSIRVQPLKGNDLQNLSQMRPGHYVCYKAPDVEPAPPMEETDSSKKEEDVDTDSGDEDVDSDSADDNMKLRRPRQRSGCSCCAISSLKDARVRIMAKEAVAYLNKQGGCTRMKLGKIRGCFLGKKFVREKPSSYGVSTKPYHLNFYTSLIEKDRTGTKTKQRWQAVLSKQLFGGIKLWLLKNENERWCKAGRCVCVFPHWDEKDERKELLKQVCPEWYPDSADGWEVVDKKIDA